MVLMQTIKTTKMGRMEPKEVKAGRQQQTNAFENGGPIRYLSFVRQE